MVGTTSPQLIGDLRGANLDGQTFLHQDLANADLTGASLVGTAFGEVDLSSANLSAVSASGALFVGSNLTGTVFSGANLSEASFGESQLLGTDLSDADLTGADFTRADLTGAILDGATLNGAEFVETAGVTNEMLASALGASEHDLAAAILRADLLVDLVPNWELKVRRACRGRPVEGAAPYTEGPWFHPVAMVKTDGDEIYSQLPKEPFGLVPDLGFLEVVACFKSIVRVVENCGQYSAGITTTPVNYSIGATVTKVRLHEAATGDLIAVEKFTGPPAHKRCPKYVSDGGVGSGAPVPYKETRPFIERYTNRP